MVDAERLRWIVARVLDDVARLRSAADGDVLADQMRLGAVKYWFVTAIEGCVRAAQHIVSSEGLGAPETNADAVRTLGRHGVVDAELAENVAKAVGFRNVLVHQYAAVDDERVVANLDLLEDLDRFVTEIADWSTRG